MRKYFWFALLALPLIAANSWAAIVPEQPFVFSSDESPSGSSYLGVDTRDITPERVSSLHLKDEQGVEVTMVDQDAPAGKAGIKEHDVILTVNGDHVESVEQLRRLIHEIPTGRLVTIGLSRNGQPMTIKAQLAARSQAFAFSGKDFHFEMPPMPSIPAIPAAIADMDLPVTVVVVHSAMRSGLMVENLTPQLADFFGTKSGQGILVRSVEKGSSAEKAGFHAGDVIVKVNGEAIADSGDFSRLLHARKDNNVSVGILRDKKEQTITMSLPERKQSENATEESFEMPEISAETRIELSNELAQMRPQIAVVQKNAMDQVQKAMIGTHKEFEEWNKHKDEYQKQMKEQMEQMRKQWGRADI
jgi:membrane-associated protease RseP (regulator of RpoE activity)